MIMMGLFRHMEFHSACRECSSNLFKMLNKVYISWNSDEISNQNMIFLVLNRHV